MHKMLFLMFIVSLVVAAAMIALNSLLSEKDSINREMLSSFECGFDPKSSARLPFSLHFFLIALIFLIFDVEITLLMPLPLVMSTWSGELMTYIYLMFLVVLVGGVVVEWVSGALDWSE